MVATIALDDYKDGQLKSMDQTIEKMQAKTETLQKKITGFKAFDVMKESFR